MAGKAGDKGQPASVSDGLVEAYHALAGSMTAPDAPQHAQELMTLQAQMLDVIHKVTGTGGAPGQAPPGAAGAPPPGGMPPGGGGPPGGPGGMNLSLLQGGAGGPSPAAPSGRSPEMDRQMAAMAAAGGGGT